MYHKKFSTILGFTIILALVLGLCFVAYSVPPEGKGKKTAPTPLGVYDGNDVFLGYLVDIGEAYRGTGSFEDFKVFDPDTSAYFWVANEPVPYIAPTGGVTTEQFTTADCSGQAYIGTTHPNELYYNTFIDQYFIVDTTIAPAPATDRVAKIEHGGSGLYEPYSPTVGYIFPIIYIDFRLADVTLAYPITVRPIEQP